jgi:hypothetical protein
MPVLAVATTHPIADLGAATAAIESLATANPDLLRSLS